MKFSRRLARSRAGGILMGLQGYGVRDDRRAYGRSARCLEGSVLAVRLRLKRIGRRHRASYRLAAVDVRRPRDGKVLEELGTYDPMAVNREQEVVLKRDRIEYWLSVGAQPSDTVRQILEREGVVQGTDSSPQTAP